MNPDVIKPIVNISFMDSINGLLLLKHQFEEDENGEQLLSPGVQIEPSELMSLAKTLANEEEEGFIPEKVIYKTSKGIAWVVKAHQRELLFNVKAKKFSIKTPLPTLIFSVIQGQLKVVAVDTETGIDANTPIYHAPLMNFYENSTMCRGGAGFPEKRDGDITLAWEHLVFKSYFSHKNHNNLIRREDSTKDVDIEYIKLLKNIEGKEEFPKELLFSKNMTLGNLLTGAGA